MLFRSRINANQEKLDLKHRFQKMLDSPFFGRVDFIYEGEEEAEPFYIGIGNFAQRTAKEHQKQVKKVDSTAGGISRMTRSAHLKQVKKVARAVTVKVTTSRTNQ